MQTITVTKSKKKENKKVKGKRSKRVVVVGKKKPTCNRCKLRKVKCSGELPACFCCLKTAEYRHRDLNTVVCCYNDPNGFCSEDKTLDQSNRKLVPVLKVKSSSSTTPKKRRTRKKKLVQPISTTLPTSPSPPLISPIQSQDKIPIKKRTLPIPNFAPLLVRLPVSMNDNENRNLLNSTSPTSSIYSHYEFDNNSRRNSIHQLENEGNEIDTGTNSTIDNNYRIQSQVLNSSTSIEDDVNLVYNEPLLNNYYYPLPPSSSVIETASHHDPIYPPSTYYFQPLPVSLPSSFSRQNEQYLGYLPPSVTHSTTEMNHTEGVKYFIPPPISDSVDTTNGNKDLDTDTEEEEEEVEVVEEEEEIIIGIKKGRDKTIHLVRAASAAYLNL